MQTPGPSRPKRASPGGEFAASKRGRGRGPATSAQEEDLVILHAAMEEKERQQSPESPQAGVFASLDPLLFWGSGVLRQGPG
jgi:hypothetical protein